jgi:hypothetical protein
LEIDLEKIDEVVFGAAWMILPPVPGVTQQKERAARA